MKESYLIFKRVDGEDEIVNRDIPSEKVARLICQNKNREVSKTDKLHATIYHYKKLETVPGFYNL